MNLYFIYVISSLYLIHSLKHFFYFKKVQNKTALENRKQSHICGYDDYAGYDHRFSFLGDLNITQLKMISQNFQKKALLKLLQNENVSIYTKMEHLYPLENLNWNFSHKLFLMDEFRFLGLD